MNEKNPNEYRDSLAQKLKGAREIDKDMAQQFLDKTHGTKEYQDARSEKISAHKKSNGENESENLEDELKQESEILSKRQENISNLSTELGGKEGIQEIFNKMSTDEKAELEQKISGIKDRIKEKEYTLNHGKVNNVVDEMWSITKMFMDVPNTWKELRPGIYIPVIQETVTAYMFVKGVAMASITGPAKGLQQIVRKIQLGFEKKKLGDYEKKLT